MNSKFLAFSILFILVTLTLSVLAADDTFMGASLYFSPLSENPRASSNFTLTIKTDSLAQAINAINGQLVFNPDKLEIINVSRIGSIFNIWLEEPNYSNLKGALSFQGGVPRPGFIGNGGTILHVIFKAKSQGITSVIWKKAEILANDGKGTNILTNLQNYDFVIDEPLSFAYGDRGPFYTNPVIVINLFLLVILGLAGLRHFIKSTLKSHDEELHRHDDNLQNHEHENEQNTTQNQPPAPV